MYYRIYIWTHYVHALLESLAARVTGAAARCVGRIRAALPEPSAAHDHYQSGPRTPLRRLRFRTTLRTLRVLIKTHLWLLDAHDSARKAIRGAADSL